MRNTIGQYRLLERIAKGGMGEVFRAKLFREAGFEKIVALKTLLPSLSDKPGFEERFCSEARIAARLNHANIVHVYDFGNDQGSFFIAMELVEGTNLGSLVAEAREKGSALSPALALKIAIEALKGLDYAHRLRDDSGREIRLIHRDISPSNILISFEGEVKLADFGLAVGRGPDRPDELAGKLAYMPPEQVLGEPLDRRSDIYSLGLVLHEMLSGRPAFPPGLPPDALMRSVVEGAFDPLSPVDFPGEVAACVAKATDRQKSGRYDTAAQMQQALEEALSKLPGSGEDLRSFMQNLFPERQSAPVALERTIVSSRPIAPVEGRVGRSELNPDEVTNGAQNGSSAGAQTDDRRSDRKGRLRGGPLTWRRALYFLLFLSVVGAFVYLFIPAEATWRVESDPPGARIFLDGILQLERTPAILPGIELNRPILVRLEAENHEAVETTVTLSQREPPPLKIELPWKRQLCKIITKPDGVTVWLDGNRMSGSTPVSLGELPLGRKHSIKLEKPGFVPFQTEFILDQKEEGEKVLSFEMSSFLKDLTVEIVPSGADLFIDGVKAKGNSPYKIEGLIPNRPVKIIASQEGYGTKTQDFTPGRDEGPIRIALEPYSSDLLFDGPGLIFKTNGRSQTGRATIPNAHKGPQIVSISGRDGALLLRIEIKQTRDNQGRYVSEAWLNIDAKPWANVSLDEGSFFSTPASGKRLLSGRHRVTFRIGGKDLSEGFILQIQ